MCCYINNILCIKRYMNILLFVVSLPTQNSTARMRIWRALKSCGAAVLRDGVYVLPQREGHSATLQAIADDVTANEGTALIFQAESLGVLDIAALFDRGEAYQALQTQITQLAAALQPAQKEDALKQARKLRKQLNAIIEIDFFSHSQPEKIGQAQVGRALQQLDLSIARLGEKHEPAFVQGDIPLLTLADFQQRVWATRQRPWVDRLASAWLIQRFIDRQAQFVWLQSPADCPPHAVGFDFDGASFSHVGNLVTFEVLLHSFALQDVALQRIAGIVHFLDVGGVQPAEAVGIETVLRGLRQDIRDDHQLVTLAAYIFDGLYANFKGETA